MSDTSSTVSDGSIAPLTQPDPRPARWLNALDAVSMVYVMVPVALFFSGWLRPYFGYPLVLLLVLATWLSWRAARVEPWVLQTPFRVHRRRMVLLAGLCFFLVACTGIGAFTFQFSDYHFNDTLLRDLMQYAPPLAYADAGVNRAPLIFTMYLSYWLPAAMAGKALSWIGDSFAWYAANYLHYVWAAIGLFLLAVWFLRIVGTSKLSFALLFLFFGGMDIFGRLFSEGGPGAANVGWWDYLTGVFWWGEGRGWLDHWSSGFALTDPALAPEMGGVFFRFYSPLSFFVDGPQHVIPGMIGVMMIVHDLWRRRTTERVLFLWSGLPLCSPFVTAGILPFIIVGFIENRARNLLSISNGIGIPVAAISISFVASAAGGGERVTGFIWEFASLDKAWWLLLLHYTVEFGILAALLPVLRQPGNHPSIFWFMGALAMFVLAPFYRVGHFNDFASKVILPAQFVFLAYVALSLRHMQTPLQRIRGAGVAVVLLIGALGPLGNVARAIDFGFLHKPLPMNSARHLNDMEPRWMLLQTRGAPESFFWSTLAKPPVYRPSELIYPNLVWNFLEPKEPLDYWIFFDGEEYELTERGLDIRTRGNRPILRRDNMNLDTDTVGKIELDIEIRVDGMPAEDAAIVVAWATPEQVAQADGEWPFQRWHTNQAYPVRTLIDSNSYWRGTAQSLAFYLRVPKGDERMYHVTIRKISFLER